MAGSLPWEVDTVVVGNGPSALILSYILHGHIPVYDLSSPHPDPILHAKLKDTQDLLHLDIDYLTETFAASRFSYSTQALPGNVLFDTLIRPYGETEEKKTCVKWLYDPSRAVTHIVAGNTTDAGGQWVNNPVKASWEIGTLSYAGMLSLPGYTFEDHYLQEYGKHIPFFLRPSREQYANYLSAYPEAVGISSAIHTRSQLSGITRVQTGFHIGSHNISCRHLILASGVFSELIQPPPLLEPLLRLPFSPSQTHQDPLLVIGSGFSAADIIISTPTSQKILHLFKWAPKTSPSPLKACHQQAYPEYAGVYRKMKLAAITFSKQHGDGPSRYARRASSVAIDFGRDWDSSYEGLPDVEIVDVQVEGDSAVVQLRNKNGDVFERRVCGLAYVVGRRGTLGYLESELQHEVAPDLEYPWMVSARTMREKANHDLEVAQDVFIIGSLTGDSLVRFAYGGCAYAAGKLMPEKLSMPPKNNIQTNHVDLLNTPRQRWQYSPSSPSIPAMNGLDGHEHSPRSLQLGDGVSN